MILILCSTLDINAKPKTEKISEKIISFNFCPIDTCFKYFINLKKDSFKVESKVGMEIKGRFSGKYERQPIEAFKKTKNISDTILYQLESITKNSYSNEGKVIYIETALNGKLKRFKIIEYTENEKLPKKLKKSYLTIMEIYEYYTNRYYKSRKVERKLNND